MYVLYDLSFSDDISRSLAVLHPQHKLAYFAKAGWEPDWIATARDIVRAEFDRTYKKTAREDENENEAAGVDSPTQMSIIGSPSFRATDVFTGQHLRQPSYSCPTVIQRAP